VLILSIRSFIGIRWMVCDSTCSSLRHGSLYYGFIFLHSAANLEDVSKWLCTLRRSNLRSRCFGTLCISTLHPLHQTAAAIGWIGAELKDVAFELPYTLTERRPGEKGYARIIIGCNGWQPTCPRMLQPYIGLLAVCDGCGRTRVSNLLALGGPRINWQRDRRGFMRVEQEVMR